MKTEHLQKIEDSTATAHIVSLHELPSSEETGIGLLDGNFSLISDVRVNLEVIAGNAEISVEELFAVKKGSVVPLDQVHNAPLAIRLNGKIVAHGELVIVGDNFGVRITEIIPPAQAAKA